GCACDGKSRAAYPGAGTSRSSSWYMTHAVGPTPASSGLPGSIVTRTSDPGMLVCDALSVAVETPAWAAIWAPPCQPTYRPPAFTQASSAFLPLAPSACSP